MTIKLFAILAVILLCIQCGFSMSYSDNFPRIIEISNLVELGSIIQQTTDVELKDQLVSGWLSPSPGFYVHISAQKQVYIDMNPVDLHSVSKKLEGYSAFVDSVAVSVLVTTEDVKNTSQQYEQILEVVRKPWVRLFIVSKKP